MKTRFEYSFFPLGNRSLLVQLPHEPSEDLLIWLLEKSALLSSKLNVEVTHSYNELLIRDLSNTSRTSVELQQVIGDLLDLPVSTFTSTSFAHKIPVCYDEDIAPDLTAYAEQVGLSIKEIVALHTRPVYPVYFIGFLPGFPYLTGLDRRLHLDRKNTPSRKIDAGSVAIGGKQTGIYPQESPGGWHIIGRTPKRIFDVRKDVPALFKAGDTITFYEISKKEFLETQEKNGAYGV